MLERVAIEATTNEKVTEHVIVLHDFDYPIHTRRTCLLKGFWLITYALFKPLALAQMPKWLRYEKYNLAKAIALLDKKLGVHAIFAFRKEVDEAFPTLRQEIKQLGFQIVDHWHLTNPRKGINEWTAKGNWSEIDHRRTYMNYDRHYVLAGKKIVPSSGSFVIWHVDHMPFNLLGYLEFLDMLEANKLK